MFCESGTQISEEGILMANDLIEGCAALSVVTKKHIERTARCSSFQWSVWQTFFNIKKKMYVYFWLLWVWVATRKIFDALYGLLSSGVWAPEWAGSVVVVRGLNCHSACEILVPWLGVESMSPALGGRFLTTRHRGSPVWQTFKVCTHC